MIDKVAQAVEDVKSVIEDRSVTFEVDETFTCLKYGGAIERCISIAKKSENEVQVLNSIEDDRIADLCIKAALHWDYGRNPRRTYLEGFKWQFGDGSSLSLPVIFYQMDKPDLVTVLAAHIAIEIDSYRDNFSVYNDYQTRYPESKDFPFDNILFFSLRHIYTSRRARKGEFYNSIKAYSSTEFGRTWLEKICFRTLQDLEDCIIGQDYKESLLEWRSLYPIRYDDFPIEFYLNSKSKKDFFDFEVEQFLAELNEECSRELMHSGNPDSRINDRLNYIKEKYLTRTGYFSDSGYDPEVLRQYTLNEYEGELSLPFGSIREKAKRRAGALHFHDLEGRLASGANRIETKLTRQQMAVLGQVLSKMEMLRPNAAFSLLAKNFMVIDGRSGKPVPIDPTNLHKIEIPEFAEDFVKRLKEF